MLSVRDLAVSFGTVDALKGVSFEVPENATVALVGESGSGKSTAALSILGLLPDSATVRGELSLEGRDLLRTPLRKIRGGEIGMVFQEPMTSLNPLFTAGFQIAEVLREHRGLDRRAARRRAVELLGEVGIADAERQVEAYPFQLSGGQQQRIMIAMAIACEPKLLIADEPTTALDVTIQKQILELLRELQRRRRMSILYITHDLGLVGDIANHVVVMRSGEIREQGPAKAVFAAPRDPYTKALLACRPRLDRRPMRLPVVEDFLKEVDFSVEERQRGVREGDEIVLQAKHLRKTFDSFEAVKDASFTLAKGRTLGIVGESGSGKTTLGLTVMRLHEASGGEVLFEGRDLLALQPREAAPYKRRIQIVFQNPYASLNPRFTVGELLLEPMRIHRIGADDTERRAAARDLLGKVGLPAAAMDRYPHEFSGGQRQRIAIARCLTMKPDVMICDEAVSALDVSVQAQLLNLLQDLQDEYRMSYLFISHDLAVVKYMSDEVMVMKDGEVVEVAGSDELYAHPQHPYTKLLLSAVSAS